MLLKRMPKYLAGGFAVAVLFALHTAATPAQLVGEISAPSLRLVTRPNEELGVTVTARNTGSLHWSAGGENPVKLATSNPRDRESFFFQAGWLSPNRLAQLSLDLQSGNSLPISFQLRAPAKFGLYRESFELVAEFLGWIEGTRFTLEIEVVPPGYRYQVVQKSPDLNLVSGTPTKLWVELKNTGTLPWLSSGPNPVKLGTAKPNDRRSSFRASSWLSENRVAFLSQAEVAPGGTARLEFEIKAPPYLGRYRESFNLVAEGLTWLPDQALSWGITVSPAFYQARFIKQSEYLVLKPGETALVWIELLNTGNVPWERGGDNPLRLGTSRPLDRASSFQHLSWLTPNRPAALNQERVMPGEIGRFEFTVQAPDKIGTYREYLRPVAEYKSWLNDLGLFWEIQVEQELVIKDPVRVGLTPASGEYLLSANGTFVVRRGNNELVARVTGGSLRLFPGSGAITLVTPGGSRNAGNFVKIIPVSQALVTVSGDGVSSTYNTFRGILEVRVSSLSGRFWLVNELELEDYLKGVAEVPSAWPPEALKAQAVLARSWVVRARQGPIADIFHLYDDSRSQVYFGYNYESVNPGIGLAAAATAGLIVKYNGEVAATYYHSDSGGYTESVENVWGAYNPARANPYLVAVPDPFAKPTEWEYLLTQDYIAERFDEELAKIGAGGEAISGLAVGERLPSGRARTLTFTTSSGKQFAVSGIRFDYLTHNNLIRSLIFEILPSAPNFLLKGKGNGHGVGLSQWSAHNLANQGKGFTEIIQIFYRGVTIE